MLRSVTVHAEDTVTRTRTTLPALVALGLVVGVVGFLAWLVAIVLVSYAMAADDSLGDTLLGTALLASPMLPGAVLLRRSLTRGTGAGFVPGLALGMTVSAGLCTTYLIVSVASG